MNRIFSAVATFLILSGLAFAQTAMRTTTLSLPVGVNDKSINLTSVTGVNGLSGGQVATILFIDKEVMYVQSVTGSSATVTRGQNGSDSTAHNAGATVYVGPPGAYGTRNLSGACTADSWPVTPYININNGNIYTCTSSNWVLSGTGGGSGTITGCGYGQTLNGTVCDVNTAVVPSNAILQSGVPLLCSGSASTTATCAMSPTLTAYTTGMLVNFVAGATNTTTYTLKIDTLGAKSILSSTAGALSAGDITSGVSYILRYDGAQFRLPASGGTTVYSVPPYLLVGSQYVIDGFNATVPPGTGSWTGRNMTNFAFSAGSSGVLRLGTNTGAAGNNTWATQEIVVGATRTLTAVIDQFGDGDCFVGLVEPAGDTIGIYIAQSTTGEKQLAFYKYSSSFSASGDIGQRMPFSGKAFVKLEVTGGNVNAYYSPDGGATWVNQSSWTDTETNIFGTTVTNSFLWAFGDRGYGTGSRFSSCYLYSWSPV